MVSNGQNVEDWRNNILTDVEGIRQILLAIKRVAVLGIRSERPSSCKETPPQSSRTLLESQLHAPLN